VAHGLLLLETHEVSGLSPAPSGEGGLLALFSFTKENMTMIKHVISYQQPSSETEPLDLVDEMNWEDSDKVEKLTLEEAGLEESSHTDQHFKEGILDYMEWFYDGELPGYTD
jgi:hypothetical protein